MTLSDVEAEINKDASNFDELVEVLNDHSLLKGISDKQDE